MPDNMDDQLINNDPTLLDGGGSNDGASGDDNNDHDASKGDDGTQNGDGPTLESLTAEMTKLKETLAQEKRRVAGQTRSWQEEKAAREQAESEVSKMKQMLGITMGDDESSTQDNIDSSSSQGNVDTLLQQRLSKVEVQLLENDFIGANPKKAFVFQNPILKQNVEQIAYLEAQQEVNENGRLISEPTEIMDRAANKVIKLVNEFKEQGAEAERQRKQNIRNSANSDLDGKNRGKQDNSDDNENFTGKDYVSSLRKIHDRTRTIIRDEGDKE